MDCFIIITAAATINVVVFGGGGGVIFMLLLFVTLVATAAIIGMVQAKIHLAWQISLNGNYLPHMVSSREKFLLWK